MGLNFTRAAKVSTGIFMITSASWWMLDSLFFPTFRFRIGKMEESKLSNLYQLYDVIMKEWERIPVHTGAFLVTFKPTGFKAVYNNGIHTKY